MNLYIDVFKRYVLGDEKLASVTILTEEQVIRTYGVSSEHLYHLQAGEVLSRNGHTVVIYTEENLRAVFS